MVQVRLKIGGKFYKPQSISIKESLTSFGKQMNITVDKPSLKYLLGNYSIATEAFIDENRIFKGFAEGFSCSVRSSDLITSIPFYDYLGLFKVISAEMSDGKDSYANKNFVSFIKGMLKQNGFENVGVINKTGETFSSKNKKFIVKKNETIAAVIDRYCREFQVLVISDAGGNLVLHKDPDTGSIGKLSLDKSFKDTNILSCDITINHKNRYGAYIVNSQTSSIKEMFYGTKADDSVKKELNQQIVVFDKDISVKKKKILYFKDSSNTEYVTKYANWMMNMNKGKSSSVRLTVSGFYSSYGKLYEIGKKIDFEGEEMLINFTDKVLDEKKGMITHLDLIYLGTYSNRKPVKEVKTKGIASRVGYYFDNIVEKISAID